eukprot:971422-Pyramimonas_sp.AAC.1
MQCVALSGIVLHCLAWLGIVAWHCLAKLALLGIVAWRCLELEALLGVARQCCVALLGIECY